ncbi:hypothetical protein Hdeb2414_s0032g00715531 [Helianthus debilis subsp. tardiflorus]
MSKFFRYRYRIYRTRYFFDINSLSTFCFFGIGCTEPYGTGYIRYWYWYPLLKIFDTGSFGIGWYRAHTMLFYLILF